MGIINSLIIQDGIFINTVDISIMDVEPCILYGPVMNSLLKFTDFLKKLKENVFKKNEFPFFLNISKNFSLN